MESSSIWTTINDSAIIDVEEWYNFVKSKFTNRCDEWKNAKYCRAKVDTGEEKKG